MSDDNSLAPESLRRTEQKIVRLTVVLDQTTNSLLTPVPVPYYVLDRQGRPRAYPSTFFDPVTGKAFGSTNPFPVITPTSAKYDNATGVAAGSTATTATFTIVNQMTLTFASAITSGSTAITVKGTTSSRVLAVITLPTMAAAQSFSVNFTPTIALTGETVTLVIGANWTSGSASVNCYGN